MKKLLIIPIMLFGIASLQAQENQLLKKAMYYLTKPDDVDSTRIYQPNKACFAVGTFFSLQRAGFDVDVNFSVNSNEMESVSGVSSFSISETPCKKIGVEVDYGNIGSATAMKLGLQAPQKRDL